MKSTKTSNTKVTNCTPVSSECVIWEGPDLACIELCHGDTISDVQARIAALLCDMKSKLDLSDLDLKCLANPSDFSDASGQGDLVSTLVVNTSRVINSGTTETNLSSYDVLPSTLSKNGDYLSFDFSGTIENTSGSKRIKIYFGTTLLFDSGTTGFPTNQQFDWVIKGEIIRTGPSTFKATTYSSNNLTSPDYVSGVEIFSNTLKLKVTGQASTTGDIAQESLIVKYHSTGSLNAPLTSYNTSLKNVISALIKQYCLLKDRVKILEDTVRQLSTTTGTGTAPSLVLTSISCLEDVNFMNQELPIPTTDSDIVQLIVNGLCKTWNNLLTEVQRLDQRITNESGGSGGTISLPKLSSDCLWIGEKSISEAWSLFDDQYCLLIAKLGPLDVMTDAINEGVSCYPTINNFLFNTGDVSDLLTMGDGSGGLALSHQNAWKTICALVSKVESMNITLSSCCGFNCKNFEVSVNAIGFDPTENTVDLRFSFDGSSTLPDPPYTFTDTGSTVVFTDSTGYSLSAFPFQIQTSSSYEDFDLTGLELSGEILVSVNLEYRVEDQVTGAIFNCTKCLNTSFKTGIACAFCKLLVSVDGSLPNIEIYYDYNGNENKITVTKEGSAMEYIIPAGSTITRIINVNNSAVTITSDCSNLVIPAIETLACYAFIISGGTYFYWAVDTYLYDITGFYIDGVSYDYTSPIRADLTNARDHLISYTAGSSELTTDCRFDAITSTDDVEYFNSLVKLQNIPTNPYVFSIEKICSFVSTPEGTLWLMSPIIIVKAISGKDIFLELNKINPLNITLDSNPNAYIKGVEIPSNLECDCCAVYDGS